MTEKAKKAGYQIEGDDAGQQIPPGHESPTSEFPISEGSDLSANVAKQSASGEFQEMLKRSAQESKRRVWSALDRGYSAGNEVLEDVEGEMSARPWSTFLTGAVVGGIVGYLIATRR